VIVSKAISVSEMLYVYEAGERVFGENYVQELVEKSQAMPRDVRWHFIGHLQLNKCKQLLSIENLDTIETIHSERLANQLQKLLPADRRLKVFIQINTSLELSKF
jgi:uncharacterized pyridoxal phosphate-containing UPF0001 family protein